MTLYTYTLWQRRSQTLARRVCVRWCGNVQNHQMRSLAVSGEGHSHSFAATERVCHARHQFAVMNGQPHKRTQLRTRTERNAQARAPRSRGADPLLRDRVPIRDSYPPQNAQVPNSRQLPKPRVPIRVSYRVPIRDSYPPQGAQVQHETVMLL